MGDLPNLVHEIFGKESFEKGFGFTVALLTFSITIGILIAGYLIT